MKSKDRQSSCKRRQTVGCPKRIAAFYAGLDAMGRRIFVACVSCAIVIIAALVSLALAP